MNYQMLRQQVIKTHEAQQPYDIELATSDLEYQYHDERPYLVYVDKRSLTSKELQLNPWAHQQLMTRLGIPSSYINKCAPELKEVNVNHFLRRQDLTWKYRVYNQNKIRAVVTPSYTPIDDIELISLTTPFFENQGVEIVEFYKDETMTSIRGVFEDQKVPIEVNDVVKIGVVINNSEVGLCSVQFRALLYRLVCANGLIAPRSFGGFHYRHRGNKDRILDLSVGAVSELTTQAQVLLADFQKTQDKIVEQPIEAIHAIVEKQKWAESWKDIFELAYSQEPNNTLYGVINAFTRGAQELSLSSRVMVEEHMYQLIQRGI